MAIELKVRNVKSGETLVAELDSFEDAITWLGSRPEFMEVLGVLSKDLSDEEHEALKGAMRPYTEEEQQFFEDSERARDEEIRQRLAEENRIAQQRMKEHAEAMIKADPGRPMKLKWHFEEGLSKLDPYDPREITDAARKAVDAWVAERHSWIEGRDQKVVEATVSVYPAEVPTGDEADRVQRGGQFVPGMA